MPIIDPDGMFGGDRIASLGDRAKVLWPWLFLASNGYGRLEINHRRLVARVFSSFEHPPLESELMQVIAEYAQKFLLFPYTVNGQLWGQFWTSEKYLPRYKSSSDQKSPAPPQDHFELWKKAYSQRKNAQVSVLPTISEKFQDPLQAFAENCKDLRVVVVVDGVVGGVGVVEKPLCPSADGRLVQTDQKQISDGSQPKSPRTLGKGPGVAERTRWFDESFWPVVWLKVGRTKALKAWLIKVHSEEMRDLVVKAAIEQGPAILQRAQHNGSTPLHPATWLNGERWEDEEQPLFAAAERKTATQNAYENAKKSIEGVDLSNVETAY